MQNVNIKQISRYLVFFLDKTIGRFYMTHRYMTTSVRSFVKSIIGILEPFLLLEDVGVKFNETNKNLLSFEKNMPNKDLVLFNKNEKHHFISVYKLNFLYLFLDFLKKNCPQFIYWESEVNTWY